jgi:hypothetical protein
MSAEYLPKSGEEAGKSERDARVDAGKLVWHPLIPWKKGTPDYKTVTTRFAGT